MAVIKTSQTKKGRGGRKKLPPEDKKVQIYVFTEQWRIDELGGMEQAQQKITTFINKSTKNKPLQA